MFHPHGLRLLKNVRSSLSNVESVQDVGVTPRKILGRGLQFFFVKKIFANKLHHLQPCVFVNLLINLASVLEFWKNGQNVQDAQNAQNVQDAQNVQTVSRCLLDVLPQPGHCGVASRDLSSCQVLGGGSLFQLRVGYHHDYNFFSSSW